MTYYSEKPSIFEPIGDGRYRYRWNIQQEVKQDIDTEIINWSCDEVFIPSPLKSNQIIEYVIGYIWPINYQQKLVNEYNAAMNGMYDETQTDLIITRYRDFLRERKEIKEHIINDCNENNIE